MTQLPARQAITVALQHFETGNLTENALNLFQTLGYNTDRRDHLTRPVYAEFREYFIRDPERFSEDRARVSDWLYVDLLFQLSLSEMKSQVPLFDTGRVDQTVMEAYLFFVIELPPAPNRSVLTQITREVNRLFPMPVMILFKHGPSLTLSIINRRLNKTDDSKDVLEKVTLIKDISIQKPHRAHIDILFDLSFPELQRVHKFTNFVKLHLAWQKTLNTRELNKRFYQELSNWYFWALEQVSFPDDIEKHAGVRNATSLIRLITRIIFIWFIKEKKLVPESFFNPEALSGIIIDFCREKSSANYYSAILQNLFFGTLNQRMGERKFAWDSDLANNKKEYGVKTLFRYQNLFAISENEALNLFRDVPFLNGGLFDCLDRENEQGRVLYADGFSRNPKQRAIVPDDLFFGPELEIDLSETYGDKKRRKEKVKGLIHILSSYKFTITENMPIEEEVALDPELLGNVFENLLASYNPETRTTARKQTGSFYTPREIVNYMVDESLKAYLKHHLEDDSEMTPEQIDETLTALLRYDEEGHGFDNNQTGLLIRAVDTCKVLDPACGSGAFPMGILHKMVHILHKLDPQNRLWKDRQIKKLDALDDSHLRERLTADIEAAFAENELDYGRKLYLIENCIYGVDIQTIAIQICKLRFFISLIVDQNINSDRENRGVRSLPNLETKFVAADTLIGLEKPRQLMISSMEIGRLENVLKLLRHRYFNAKTRKEKLDCQKTDRELRKNIAALLQKGGWGSTTAEHVAAFDPYDQNTGATWFDAEWMFGVRDGFDVVIGNPPYIQIQNFSGKPQQKDWENQHYETYVKTGDVYCLFYEQGYRLLKDGGILTFITSNKWMRANYGKSLRKFFMTKGSISQLIDFGDSPIFENATTYTNILVWKKNRQKCRPIVWDLSKVYKNDMSLEMLLKMESACESLFTENSFVVVKSEQIVIKRRIEEIGVPLKDWDIAIYRGVLTGLNEAFVINGKKRSDLIAKDPKSAEIIKPILRGRDIKRYKAEFADFWLINAHNGYIDKNGNKVPRIEVQKNYPGIWEYLFRYNEDNKDKLKNRSDQGQHWSNLRNCTYYEAFEKPKVIFGRFMDKPTYTYDEEGFFINDALYFAAPATRYLAAVLNSKTNWFYLTQLCTDLANGFLQALLQYQVEIPVPQISYDKQHIFNILVDCILYAKAHDMNAESSTLEWVVDVMVFGLYFEPEMRTAQCYINNRIAEVIRPFTADDTDAFKADYIKSFVRFCNRDDIVRHGLNHCRLVRPVKIILGDSK